MIDPDSATKERIKNLAKVGKALNDTYSEQNMETGSDFFLALESLEKFKDGIDMLNLDDESKKGIYDLIEYLRKKINRRIGYVG